MLYIYIYMCVCVCVFIYTHVSCILYAIYCALYMYAVYFLGIVYYLYCSIFAIHLLSTCNIYIYIHTYTQNNIYDGLAVIYAPNICHMRCIVKLYVMYCILYIVYYILPAGAFLVFYGRSHMLTEAILGSLGLHLELQADILLQTSRHPAP